MSKKQMGVSASRRLQSPFAPASRKSVKQPSREQRVQPRFTAQFRGTFSGMRGEGQGRTLDISAGGCKIKSDMPVTIGESFECRLHVPGLGWPLRIDEVTVRWVEGKLSGIAFTRMRQDEAAKLARVLTELEQND